MEPDTEAVAAAPPSVDISPTQKAASEPALALMRDLVRTYQAFYTYDEEHIRTLGLTVPQFDVICTLGNTSGMMMGQLAEKTLVTKGTLTGIIDRLESKGLVRREVPPENRRCFIVALTPQGEQMFEVIFPAHIAYLKERLSVLSDAEMESIRMALKQLRQVFGNVGGRG
jgi:MarR family transcriptional regulator, 2-MHQ and catechol-resistance regulon repressor